MKQANEASGPVENNPFERFAPFIQNFIYRAGWTDLRAIQVQAARAVFNAADHLLITSGTASGKTEAAFLPVLTLLHEDPPASIGALYIGPLNALINDQFRRLEAVLAESTIPVQRWHGDVDAGSKSRFLKRGRGVLQITPESLESMLIKRHTELPRLFADLRFVIIDELHAFISSDRGRQILCQLERLAPYQKALPRRIGLSATLGKPEQAMAWLAGSTGVPVQHVHDSGGKREILLGLEHFKEPSADLNARIERANQRQDAQAVAALQAEQAEYEALYDHLYTLTQGKKSLIFTNTRRDAEAVITRLRERAARRNTSDIYYVHHGSIAAPLRTAAEQAMQDPEQPACTSATVTLELGIDIGQLDLVAQMNATYSVSSFVQRLGRSGRRGSPSTMFFYSLERDKDAETVVQQLPWSLLQAIAIIQLYVEAKWIEPPDLPALPLSLLYHQTMSTLAACTELTPPQLAERILTLAPFAHVTQDHYRTLLRHLLDIRHLERTETGGLIIGLEGEKIVNDYHFFATFADDKAFSVRDGSREVGTLQTAPALGERLTLAGFAWKVTHVDQRSRVIMVERVAGRAQTAWSSGSGMVHTRVLERMRQVLRDTENYAYLHPRALARVHDARRAAKRAGLLEQAIVPVGGNRYALLPWIGTRAFHTLQGMLAARGIKPVQADVPYFMEIDLPPDQSPTEVLSQLAAAPPSAESLVVDLPRPILEHGKFDRFIPEILLREAYARDYLDVEAVVAALCSEPQTP